MLRNGVRSLITSLTRENALKPGSVYVPEAGEARYKKDPFYQVKMQTKHRDAKNRKLRGLKFIKVELPNFHEREEMFKFSKEEFRSKMKERGVQPPRPWIEKPFDLTSTPSVFEPYVPPEGDGKVSFTTPLSYTKQTGLRIEKKSKSWMAIRKIRSYDEDFNSTEFAMEAQGIYIKVHERIAEKDQTALEDLITEKLYGDLMDDYALKTIHWKFLESIEPPRLVHARVTSVVSKDNLFAQVTCRFNTRQILAVYDRFGRLIHGSEVISKDVLEYVVFEKHLSNLYGMWRVHEKIIPDWMEPREPQIRTFVKPKPCPEGPQDHKPSSIMKDATDEPPAEVKPSSESPPVSLA